MADGQNSADSVDDLGQSGPPAATVGVAGWAITALLALGVMIAYADRASISAVIASKTFVHHFDLSDVNRGWLGSAFFWSYALAQIPMGWIVDRYGAKTPYAICFALW